MKNPMSINLPTTGFIVIVISVLVGVLVVLPIQGVGLYLLPVGGIIGGILGGIGIGSLSLSAQEALDEKRKFLYAAIVICIVLGISLFGLLIILIIPPGLIDSIIVFLVTRMVRVQLKKSPFNGWSFAIRLIISIVIIVFSTGFLVIFGASFMAQ
jgi:hypothetical protein